jgi:hypothetical protein
MNTLSYITATIDEMWDMKYVLTRWKHTTVPKTSLDITIVADWVGDSSKVSTVW